MILQLHKRKSSSWFACKIFGRIEKPLVKIRDHNEFWVKKKSDHEQGKIKQSEISSEMKARRNIYSRPESIAAKNIKKTVFSKNLRYL